MGGALLVAGHAPVSLVGAGWVAVTPLLLVARSVSASSRRPVRAGAGWGLLAGLVAFLPLLSWISRFGLLPWVLLSLVQGATVAAFVAGVAAWGPRRGRAAAAVVLWVALEAVRSSVPLGGFPWGLLGLTQSGGGPLLDLARVLGVLGVSGALVAVAAAVEAALARPREALRPLLGGLGVVALAALVGAVAPRPVETGETVDIAGVQGYDLALAPVVDREDVERVTDVAEQQLAETVRMAAAGGGAPDVTVWPENSLDTDPRTAPQVQALVEDALDALDGGRLVANALLSGPQPRTFLNALVAFSPDGGVGQVYVKRRLVPFGEYVPFRSVFGDFGPLRAIVADGVPGDGPEVFELAGARIGPVTCFESIFPEVVRSQVRAGAQVLVVSTNNSSFGRTAASEQHLMHSQLRAVETGRWILHAGISGISGVVDPRGRVTQQTELFEPTTVRADLPLVEGETLATRVGWLVGPLCVMLSACGLVLLVVRRRHRDAAPAAGAEAVVAR